MIRLTPLLIILFTLYSCGSNHKDKEFIDENKLGIIDASVDSRETNLNTKAVYNDDMPGKSKIIDRAYENAPPMIPHTTDGFLPIKIYNNICLTCHTPELAKAVGAIPLPPTHFANLRPKMLEVDGVMQFVITNEVVVEDLKNLNHAYFNCSQCHAPQTSVTIDIENLFTPEFREEFGLNQSSLKEKLKEGI